jgi:thiamine-phosphate pyrophosphorylase
LPPPVDLRVYLVTDRHHTAGRPLVEVVGKALEGNVRTVQLRERDLDTRRLLAEARALRALTREYGARLLINERIDVALACDADGVHLPANSFAIADARSLLGADSIIGVSTHHPEEASRAAQNGADFAVLGPIYDTPSKRSFGPALGVESLREAVGRCDIPLIAIGGVTAANVPELLRAGAQGVAVIRAILAAADPEQAARALTGYALP